MTFHEKLRMLRKEYHLTQKQFAASIGISRANLTNIELGKVKPTPLFINCVSLMYNIDKDWLLDNSKEDCTVLKKSAYMSSLIMEKYEQLDERYKKFAAQQIIELLELQQDTTD